MVYLQDLSLDRLEKFFAKVDFNDVPCFMMSTSRGYVIVNCYRANLKYT